MSSRPGDRNHHFSCSLVIPCYNEAHRLAVVTYREYLLAHPFVRIIFVDDGSTDDTFHVLRRLAEGFGTRVSVLQCGHNRGKGEAVRLGMLHTMRVDRPTIIGFWDADLATPLEAVASLDAVLENNAALVMVFASRVKLLGRDIYRNPWRHYLGRIFATVASIVLSMPVYDTQCGAKLFRVTPLVESVFEEPFLSRWVFDVEIFARFRRSLGKSAEPLGHLLYEFPLETWRDISGSKVTPLDFVHALVDTMRIWRCYLRF